MLDQRGVVLGHFVHLANRGVHLLDGGSLLTALLRDVVEQRSIAPDRFQHRLQLGRCIGHQPRAGSHLGGRLLDQHLHITRRFRGGLRQAADFDRHHGEALAGFAGAGRFHRGVERQQIGLEGNVVDHADDIGDLARAFGDPLHGVVGADHHRTAFLGGNSHGLGIFGSAAGPLGVLHDRLRQLLHCSGRFLDRRCLLGGALGKIVGA